MSILKKKSSKSKTTESSAPAQPPPPSPTILPSVLGWHGLFKDPLAMRFINRNRDEREIKIGESLSVERKPGDEAYTLGRNGFHCCNFPYLFQTNWANEDGQEYVQRVEVIDVRDKESNDSIHVGTTRKCLGIFNINTIHRQILAKLWLSLLPEIQAKFRGNPLPDLEELLNTYRLGTITSVTKKTGEQIAEAVKLMVNGRHVRESYGMMNRRMGMGFGIPMGIMFCGNEAPWPGEVPYLDGAPETLKLGEKFLRSMLDNRLEDLFAEAQDTMKRLNSLPGVRMLMEKTNALSSALELFYKGSYPAFIISRLCEFLTGHNECSWIEKYAEVKTALSTIGAQEIFTLETPHELSKNSIPIQDDTWKQFESVCLHAAKQSLETKMVVERMNIA